MVAPNRTWKNICCRLTHQKVVGGGESVCRASRQPFIKTAAHVSNQPGLGAFVVWAMCVLANRIFCSRNRFVFE